jgi:nitrogen fixation/metabolism regulation signal transduction histidine kinase
MKHEHRILLLSAIGPFPAVAAALAFLWTSDYSTELQVSLTSAMMIFWLICLVAVHQRLVFPLRTVSNMLGALRERDFSMRVRGARRDDTMGEVLLEVNSLTELLREQRLGAMEASALLRRVMAQIDVAILAFDSSGRLRLLNQYAEHLLARPTEELLGARASDLGLGACLEGEAPRTLQLNVHGGGGRWELRRGTFLERGQPQQLVVLSDVTRALREEELQAWKRLVQVLRHEVNNSLAPIQSLAQSLTKLLGDARPADWEQDLREGLSVIASRSMSLNRFMSAYAQLSRLPAPRKAQIRVAELLRRAATLETRVRPQIVEGPDISIVGDADQLEQLLINLIRNAAEATECSGQVEIGWNTIGDSPGWCEVRVEDTGPGIANPTNLFVPFYTTKPSGSGIGLVLSRQIAEAHGGTLTLENRPDGRGCRAQCRLPITGS